MANKLLSITLFLIFIVVKIVKIIEIMLNTKIGISVLTNIRDIIIGIMLALDNSLLLFLISLLIIIVVIILIVIGTR